MDYLVGFVIGMLVHWGIASILNGWKEAKEEQQKALDKEALRSQTPLNWTVEKIITVGGEVSYSFAHNNTGNHWKYYQHYMGFLDKAKNSGAPISEEQALGYLQYIQDMYRKDQIKTTERLHTTLTQDRYRV